MKATPVCAIRWAEITIDVFRVGIPGKAVRYGGGLRGVFDARAQPPDERGAWFRSVKQVAAHFGITEGSRVEWSPHEEPDAECTGCGWRFWSGTGHPTLALCADCISEKADEVAHAAARCADVEESKRQYARTGRAMPWEDTTLAVMAGVALSARAIQDAESAEHNMRVARQKLTKAQEERLMRHHLDGDSSGAPSTAKALLAAGLLGTINGRVVVTAAGKAYCDELHARNIRKLEKRQ